MKINPLNCSSNGSTFSPDSVFLAEGLGAKSTKASKNVCTPKPVKADPKNTGVNFPFAIASSLKSFPASNNNCASSMACSYKVDCLNA